MVKAVLKRAAGLCLCLWLLIVDGTMHLVAGEVRELDLKPDAITRLIHPYAFQIQNAARGKIVFFLAGEEQELSRQELAENALQQFSDGKSEGYTIEIPTAGRTPVRYRLRSGKRYQLYWNDVRKRWDMSELVPR
jgi:hypothetical protein